MVRNWSHPCRFLPPLELLVHIVGTDCVHVSAGIVIVRVVTGAARCNHGSILRWIIHSPCCIDDVAVSQSQPSLGKSWPRTKFNRNSKLYVTFATVLLLPSNFVSDCIPKPEQHS